MSTTPGRPLSAFSRLKQVYVDIPPSPIPLYKYSSLGNPTPGTGLARGMLKENTPSEQVDSVIRQSSTLSLKRKPRGGDSGSSDMARVPSKKLKLGEPNVKPPLVSGAFGPNVAPALYTPPEFPDGYIYCHQCSRKRDMKSAIQCTVNKLYHSKKNTRKERRCSVKMCKKCLSNHYGENTEKLKSIGNREKGGEHVDHERYAFKCPKCRDVCTCWRCRKERKPQQIKDRNVVAPKATIAHSTSLHVDDPKGARGHQTGRQQKVESTTHTPGSPVGTQSDQKLKPPPIVNWTPVATNLNLLQAEMRFQIREFCIRFSCIMDPAIPRAHLRELDEIVGPSKGRSTEDTGSWVSEVCVRSILTGILSLLVNRDADNILKKSINNAIKEIRETGANLNKVWAALVKLREFSSPDAGPDCFLYFPDPSPLPKLTTVYNTRHMQDSVRRFVKVSQSAQLIPVLNALIEASFDMDVIREEINSGAREEKERMRKVRELVKNAHESWETERRSIEDLIKDGRKEMKSKRDAYKRSVQRLEHIPKLLSPNFAPRFSPLGRDNDGRVFYTLSPGIIEIQAALGFISPETLPNHQTRREIGERLSNEASRAAMKQWPWFVAVWGKKPLAERSKSCQSNEFTYEEDEDVEKWWGFHEPSNICDLANWVAHASATTQPDRSLGPSISDLVRGLKEYARLLDWRIREDSTNTRS